MGMTSQKITCDNLWRIDYSYSKVLVTKSCFHTSYPKESFILYKVCWWFLTHSTSYSFVKCEHQFISKYQKNCFWLNQSLKVTVCKSRPCGYGHLIYCRFLILRAAYLIPRFNCFPSNCENMKSQTPHFYHRCMFFTYVCKIKFILRF